MRGNIVYSIKGFQHVINQNVAGLKIKKYVLTCNLFQMTYFGCNKP